MKAPIRLYFAVPHYLNSFYKISHTGSIRINYDVGIVIRSTIRQPWSSDTILCFKWLVGDIIRIPDFDASKLLLSPLDRLNSFLTEIHIDNHLGIRIRDDDRMHKTVRTLVLNNVGLTAIPDFIGNLSSLTTLSLPNNNLTSIPPTIRKLNRLKQLTLDNNPHLHSLEEINGHPSLTSLMARSCSIERLPRGLPQLTNLYLSSNRLTNLNGIQTLGYATGKEKSYFLDQNRIESVPDEISSMKNLTILNLNNNLLFELPAKIVDIPSLRELSIEKNCFRSDVLLDMASEFNMTHPKMKFNYKEQRLSPKGVCPKN